MKILVVGGGAGGLELVTKLGNKLGRPGPGRRVRAEITLVDRNPSHIWKPLLHEVATGTLDSDIDEISYLAHASQHHFQFQLGTLIALDRRQRTITLAAITDEQDEIIVNQRQLDYDLLVLSIGSVSNDFDTDGIAEHCIFLDSRHQAEYFHQQLLRTILKQSQSGPATTLDIAIVGGGATGVELSAELFHATRTLRSYGLATDQKLKVSLVEAGERILPGLPENIAEAAKTELEKLGVAVTTQTRVTRATAEGLYTATGEFITAPLKVWAAGIKAPDVLSDLDGLETNRLHQLVVKPTLQTTLDERIFAFGDCAACPIDAERWVPPRAQAAHQQASLLARNIKAFQRGQALKVYVYRDYGSLVSLSKYSTIGNLMGNLLGAGMMIEGRIARLMYISLYRLHQKALHGWYRMLLIALVGRINSVIRPRLKLH